MSITINVRLMAVVAGCALLGMMNTEALAGVHLSPCELQDPAVQGPSTPADPPSGGTTISTVRQAYFCIFDNYFSGPNLSSRALLVPAFAGLTEEMQRRRFDNSRAQPSAFTGNRFRDWEAFSRTYAEIAANLPAATQQALAQAALQAMIDSLHDNHAAWQRSRTGSAQVGVTLSIFRGPPLAGVLDPVAQQPIFVTAVGRNSPAEQAGIRLGDEIIAVNDVPLYVNGELSKGVLRWITQPTDEAVLNLTVHRPATNATLAISLIPARMPVGPGSPPQATLLAGNIAYARLLGFTLTNVDALLQSVAALANSTRLRGLVLDLRENGGGMAEANARLLGAFAHNVVTGYWCDAKDKCTATRSDASVPLLNLPLVALIDRTCVSACDVFSNAVKDAKLGKLVGTRTGGNVGPSYRYVLNDGTALFLPKFYQLGANREDINMIGVPPHVYAPVTALDLSTGHDPALAKALDLLR